MNLIEQLGGYENVKGIREAYIKNGWSVSDVAKGFHQYFTIEQLDLTLLQHRRENNIFEMGDYIIFDNELMCFAMWSSSNPDYAYIGYPNDEDGVMVYRNRFCHATDAEIEAWHRL